jgi:hypothetical protein
MSTPNLGTIVMHGDFPAVVCVTHDSWNAATMGPEVTEYPIPQPSASEVGIFSFRNWGTFPNPEVVAISSLTYPDYTVQAR